VQLGYLTLSFRKILQLTAKRFSSALLGNIFFLPEWFWLHWNNSNLWYQNLSATASTITTVQPTSLKIDLRMAMLAIKMTTTTLISAAMDAE
jgi:hypothetical protein